MKYRLVKASPIAEGRQYWLINSRVRTFAVVTDKGSALFCHFEGHAYPWFAVFNGLRSRCMRDTIDRCLAYIELCDLQRSKLPPRMK